GHAEQRPEDLLAGDRRVLAVARQARTHAARRTGILERSIPEEHRHVLSAADRADEPVEVADPLGLQAVGAVPREDLDRDDGDLQLFGVTDHRAEVPRRLLRRPPLRDVVQATLDDDDLGAEGTAREPLRELIRAIAFYTAVAEREAAVAAPSRVLPLVVGVEDPGIDRRPDRRVRVPLACA